MPKTPLDPARLTADLIRCASVTGGGRGPAPVGRGPERGVGLPVSGWIGAVSPISLPAGVKGLRAVSALTGIPMWCRWGDLAAWSVPPFGGVEKDGMIWGRGATDMKSGVAAFAAAAVDFVRDTPPDGAVILAITGDEEGDALDGTVALLDWMQAQRRGHDSLPCRRADLPRAHGRDDQDRAARFALGLVHADRGAGTFPPIRIAPAIRCLRWRG